MQFPVEHQEKTTPHYLTNLSEMTPAHLVALHGLMRFTDVNFQMQGVSDLLRFEFFTGNSKLGNTLVFLIKDGFLVKERYNTFERVLDNEYVESNEGLLTDLCWELNV